MLSINEYLKDPCGSASIPYWKQKNLTLPDDMKIVHDDDFVKNRFKDYTDERYFRLYHDLKEIQRNDLDTVEIVTAKPDMINEFVGIINASYGDLSVTGEQMRAYLDTPVYDPELWILLKDKRTGDFIGSGIADHDKEVGELILEWIQVLPEHRKRGYGQIIVNGLLARMKNIARFATVSGKVNNPTNPEALYRKCGFVGNDVWHILTKKKRRPALI